MGSPILRRVTFMLLIAILIWSCFTDICDARRGKHWRQNRGSSSSLYKKKTKGHKSNHQHGNAGRYKHKTPSLGSSLPPPSPKAAPPTKRLPEPGIPSAPKRKGYNNGHSKVYNVMDFGAKGNGASDDTKAFQAAWAAACKVDASKIMVPSKHTFLVGPISFSGPYCQPNIIFQLEGIIVAPTSSKPWGSGLLQWLEFTKLKGLTITGSGIIDGRGSLWWSQDSLYDDPVNDESKSSALLNGTVDQIGNSLAEKMPSIKPTALRFYGSSNVTVTGITIQNSPLCHLKFDNCEGVSVFNFTASSPANSPNTDGIHLQNSRDVLIHSSNLASGDDCISIQTGCANVYIRDINCGPGHGISIGSLGRDGTKACVSNITVRDIKMHNTMYGARIKTWQGGSGSVQGVLFSNIQLSEVEVPIIIDQYYCDKRTCKNQTSAVALSGITYERMRGTYTVKPVHLACSDNLPCVDVTLNHIELKPHQEKYHMYDPFCWQTFGELYSPTTPHIGCLRGGKPPNNRVHYYHETC